jgi:hypothetical protein
MWILKNFDMKLIATSFFIFFQIALTSAQCIDINQITPTQVDGGINVNLSLTTCSGASYLNHSYTITENTVDLSICYLINPLQIVINFNEDYFIPVVNSGNYTINVSIFYSLSETVCDYFMNGPTETVNFLSNNNFENATGNLELFPNPTMGKVELKNNQAIKRVEIFNNVGRLIKIIKDIPNSQIDLSEFDDGLYLLKVESQEGSQIKKLIIRK